MRTTVRRRSLWLTVPMYVVMVAILALDVWTTAFWFRVGGALGWAIGATEFMVAVLLGLVLAFDARRQWLMSRPLDDRSSQGRSGGSPLARGRRDPGRRADPHGTAP